MVVGKDAMYANVSVQLTEVESQETYRPSMNFLQLLRSQPGLVQRLYVHMLAGARQFPET